EILKTIYRELKKIEAKFYEYTNKPQPIQSTNLSIAKDLMSKNAPLDPVTITEQLTFELLEAKFKTIEKFIDEELKKYKPITVGMVKDWIKKISTDQTLINTVTEWLGNLAQGDDENIRENIESWQTTIRKNKENRNQEPNKKLLLYIDDLLAQAIITKAIAEEWLKKENVKIKAPLDKEKIKAQEKALAEIEKWIEKKKEEIEIGDLKDWGIEISRNLTILDLPINERFLHHFIKEIYAYFAKNFTKTAAKKWIAERKQKIAHVPAEKKNKQELAIAEIGKKLRTYDQDANIKETLTKWRDELFAQSTLVGNEILIQYIAILLKQGTITKRMIEERIEKAKGDNETIKQIEQLLKERLKKAGKVLNDNDDIKQDIQSWKTENLGSYIDNLLASSKAEPDGFIKDLVAFLTGEEIKPVSHDLGVAGFEILLSKLSELFKKLKVLNEEGNKEALNEKAKNMWKIFSRITISKFKEEIESDLDRFVTE
ncbi:MAG: hypothetical protein ABH827_06420, partial [bacterium]